MPRRQSLFHPACLLATFALPIVAASGLTAQAAFPVIGFDSLMNQKATGRETFGAMGLAPRVGSGGAGVPGVLFNDGFNSFEVDAQVIDDVNNQFNGTAFGAVGGYFWRGTDLFGVNFDPSQYQLEVKFKPGANNAATQFEVAIDQHDGFADSPGTTQSQGEQFRWSFTDFVNRYNTAVGLGQADPEGYVTLTRDITELPNPVNGSLTESWEGRNATATGFVLPGDNTLDLDAIESGARNGVMRLQLRSFFNSTDRLNVRVKDIKFVPKTPVPELVRVDGKSAYTSSFNSAQNVGAVDRTGSSLVLDLNTAGGVQVYQPVTSFDGTQYGVEVTAKLLANNNATSLRIVGKDLDGNDNAANAGAEEWALAFDTASFNSSTFTAVTLPWSTAVISAQPAFGFANGGDTSIANFDLFQFQVANATAGRLNMEIQSVKLIPLAGPGDFNGDGGVDGFDFLLWQRGGSPNGVFSGDYATWKANFGASAVAASGAVPEPGAVCLVVFSGIGAFRFRRPLQSIA